MDSECNVGYPDFCGTICLVEFRQSAFKHGVTVEAIKHAVPNLLFVSERFQEDPDKVLILGPDHAGNILEVIGFCDADTDVLLVIHAMNARTTCLPLLAP